MSGKSELDCHRYETGGCTTDKLDPKQNRCNSFQNSIADCTIYILWQCRIWCQLKVNLLTNSNIKIYGQITHDGPYSIVEQDYYVHILQTARLRFFERDVEPSEPGKVVVSGSFWNTLITAHQPSWRKRLAPYLRPERPVLARTRPVGSWGCGKNIYLRLTNLNVQLTLKDSQPSLVAAIEKRTRSHW